MLRIGRSLPALMLAAGVAAAAPACAAQTYGYGYPRNGGMPGNVLLAFAPEE